MLRFGWAVGARGSLGMSYWKEGDILVEGGGSGSEVCSEADKRADL